MKKLFLFLFLIPIFLFGQIDSNKILKINHDAYLLKIHLNEINLNSLDSQIKLYKKNKDTINLIVCYYIKNNKKKEYKTLKKNIKIK